MSGWAEGATAQPSGAATAKMPICGAWGDFQRSPHNGGIDQSAKIWAGAAAGSVR